MVKMVFSHNLLRERIRKKFPTFKSFANALELHPMSLWRKMECQVDFTASEIALACFLLDIEEKDIAKYFMEKE